MALVLCGSAAQAQSAPDIAAPLFYLTHGINCVPKAGKVVTGQDTVDGEIIQYESKGLPILIQTTRVPAKVGISMMTAFGVHPDTPPGVLTATVTHPAMGAQNTTHQTWQIAIKGGDQKAMGYLLEDTFEEVTGPWVFTLHLEGAPVMRSVFTLVPPDDAPEVMDRCFPDVVPGS